MKIYIKTGGKQAIEALKGKGGFAVVEVMCCSDAKIADPGNEKNWHEIKFCKPTRNERG